MNNIVSNINAVCTTMEKGIVLSDIESMKKLVGCYEYLRKTAKELEAKTDGESGE